MMGIIMAAVIVGGVGLIIGLFLGFSGEKFKVEADERETAVRAELPGNNCGGCGYPGCDGLAAAIVKGEAPVNGCPVGGAAVAEKIGAIMGAEVTETVRMTAFVKCNGDCDKSTKAYDYNGVQDCSVVSFMQNGGDKTCTYGCLGYGTCKKACPFGAIDIVNGIAKVDEEKCKACGKCVVACPRQLIELVPYDSDIRVSCSSRDKGIDVKKACTAGCIGCSICQRDCPLDAIKVENFLAHIDYDVCVGCGLCERKCPGKCITSKETR